jgi:hypothetical protein
MPRTAPSRLATFAVVLAAIAPAAAHHSINGVYDSARSATVEGRVAEFRFVNPHPLLFIEVETPGGTQSWQLEMDNRFELVAIGMAEDTFVPGDRVVATGSLGRTEPQRLYLRKLDRPADGLLYEQRGMTPILRQPRG